MAGTFVEPPLGWRRARDAEVTPLMRAKAVESLSADLGSLLGPFVDERGREYLLAVETHSNAPKGVSVFVRKETQQVRREASPLPWALAIGAILIVASWPSRRAFA